MLEGARGLDEHRSEEELFAEVREVLTSYEILLDGRISPMLDGFSKKFLALCTNGQEVEVRAWLESQGAFQKAVADLAAHIPTLRRALDSNTPYPPDTALALEEFQIAMKNYLPQEKVAAHVLLPALNKAPGS